jgi:hypothetical protein
VPLDATVNLDHLSSTFELSGGEIKNVALRATALALEQPSLALSQALLARCANAEYRNMGKLPLSLTERRA